MFGIKRLGSSYASIAATAALVLALGMGGAYAAGKITSKKIAVGAVKSKQIKDGQVRTADLATDAAIAFAKRANTSETADSAKTANSAQTAGTAGTATTADTAKAVAPNSVTGAGVADGSLGGADLATDSINAAKLQDDSVTTSEILDRSIDFTDLGRGAVGPAQLQDYSVTGGAIGPMKTIVSQGTSIGADKSGNAGVSCPGGTTLMSGGFSWADDEQSTVVYSAPAQLAPGSAWVVRGYVPSGSNVLYAWASCLEQ